MEKADNRQSSHLDLGVGSFRLEARLSVTPAGLRAIGALVSGVRLSTVVLVQAARK